MIGERPLRYLRRFNYVAHASAREPALVHDAKSLPQYLFAVRRLTHERNMYVRITNVKRAWIKLLPLMPQLGPRFGAWRPFNLGGRLGKAAIPSCTSAVPTIFVGHSVSPAMSGNSTPRSTPSTTNSTSGLLRMARSTIS